MASGSVDLRKNSTPALLSISRTGEEHLVEISTRKTNAEARPGAGPSRYRLVAPDGSTVVEDSELVSHKKRFFEFVPYEAGEYSLYAEEATLLGSGRGTAWVSVTVGDRRMLSRYLRF